MLIDRIILVCTVIIATVYMYGTTQIPTLEIGDPLGPKAFPRLLGIGLFLAAAFLAFEIWRNKHKHRESSETSPFEARVVLVLAAVVVWTGAYYLCFVPLGYIVATTLYLLPMMAGFNPGKWLANVVTALLFSIGTYWLFVKLDVALPKGVLPI